MPNSWPGKGAVTLNGTSTLLMHAGGGARTGAVTVKSNAALEVAESGMVMLGGTFELMDGATLKFNFTDKKTPPLLNLKDKDVTFGVRAASYNIRIDTTESNSANDWNNRKAALVNLVNSISPDVIGFQEVRPTQYAYLKEQFSAYTFVGAYRDNLSSSEATPVAFSTSRFALMDRGTFWLSATPDKVGSKKWGDGIENSEYPRICTWALLRDKATGGVFCFASTHLDLLAGPRLAGMRLILSMLVSKYEAVGVPVVVVGDMNALETEDSMTEAAAAMQDSLLYSKTTQTGSWRTFNNWNWNGSEVLCVDALADYTAAQRTAKKSTIGKRIDYIFSSFGTEVESFATRNDARPGKQYYPSDHYPVAADLKLSCANSLYFGKVQVVVDKDSELSRVAYGRYVLTKGAKLHDAGNLEFVLPDWVGRATVEDGEIVIYTKPKPFSLRIR